MATHYNSVNVPSFTIAEIPHPLDPPSGYTVLLYTRHRGQSRYFRYDLFVGKAGEKNIGYAVVKTMHNRLYLDGLRIQEEHQGKGLARFLLKLAIANHGSEQMYLRARPFKDQTSSLNKQQLIEFYQRYGFTLLNDKGLMVLPLTNA